ncbi:MAG: DNA-processing protein DprA, partial [Clostridiales Family XIII bacterium]|nr:DNA-processing protein DprA [Clostridiales Family XIII bacterium]
MKTVELHDTDYPLLLSLIQDPPQKLWYRGDLSVLDNRTIAIVGSRRATEYGKWAARTMAKRYSDHGIVIISGMAEGIDSFAHEGALCGSSPTVAVFGCGVDICFPQGNQILLQRILENGLLLSEYPPGFRPARYTFPARNRIISGLSYATVVVEAALSSGSLITAERAAEQGREVYAVPGNINRKTSIGSNKLIADGARPLVFIDDVLTDMGVPIRDEVRKGVALSASENKIYEIIKRNGEIRVEEIVALGGFSVQTTR